MTEILTADPGTAAAGTASPVPTVTVFSKNDCSICVATEAKLTERGVPFREINVQEDAEPRDEFGGRTPLEHVLENYGRSMPAVVVDDGTEKDSWTGRRPDKLLQLIGRFEALGALIPAEERTTRTGIPSTP